MYVQGKGLTLHASLDNVERMHYQRRDGAGTEAGDGLDGRGGETRMVEVGHIVGDKFNLQETVTFYEQDQKRESVVVEDGKFLILDVVDIIFFFLRSGAELSRKLCRASTSQGALFRLHEPRRRLTRRTRK
jgi:hypothetical protein